MSAFHPELTGARWLPRTLFRPWLRPLLRLNESLMARRAGESVALEGGGEALIFRPRREHTGLCPGILWIHGGGLVMGHAVQDQDLCQEVADELGAVVVSAQYRLVPEHSYPIPVEDCFRALQALAGLPGVDSERLAVAGMSAGGGLSAAVALLARERGVPLRFQVLIYPMLDDRSSDRPHVNARGVRLWDAKANRFGWSHYLADVDPANIPESAVPARCADLSGLPPAWLGVGTLDLFHDEDLLYASRLQEAGVACEVHVVEGAYHSFDIVHTNAPVTQAFRQSWVGALRVALAPVPAKPER